MKRLISQAQLLGFLGTVRRRYGHDGQARTYHEQALSLAQELNTLTEVVASGAGLAQLALARGDLVQAQSRVEAILRYLDEKQAKALADGMLNIEQQNSVAAVLGLTRPEA